AVGARAARAIFPFFLQADAGIRPFHVTGVETCALPLSIAGPASGSPAPSWARHWERCAAVPACTCSTPPGRSPRRPATRGSRTRSGERRVGGGGGGRAAGGAGSGRAGRWRAEEDGWTEE